MIRLKLLVSIVNNKKNISISLIRSKVMVKIIKIIKSTPCTFVQNIGTPEYRYRSTLAISATTVYFEYNIVDLQVIGYIYIYSYYVLYSIKSHFSPVTKCSFLCIQHILQVLVTPVQQIDLDLEYQCPLHLHLGEK